MFAAIVSWAVHHRLLVLLGTVALIVAGVRGYVSLTVDAVPDVTNVQVQVLTSAPGLSPLEVESLVTRPVELAMMGLPGTRTTRSISRSAVSAVTIVFEDDVELAAARSLVSQRLGAAREAAGGTRRPELGPLTTGLGEIYHFTVRWPGHASAEVRTLLDWEITYGLKSVPGVVEVNGWGGDTRQVEVRLRPSDLQALGVTQRQVEETLLAGGQNAGGGAIERGEEQALVRLDGQYRSVDQIAQQVIGTRPGGAPILVRDVATVRDGVAPRLSAATADGQGETVYAMVQMVAGGNAHQVVARVKQRLDEIKRHLPAGVAVEPFYDRAALVDRVLGTVKRSLAEGGAVVIFVLFALLGDIGAGLVVATAIPLAMLGAFALMNVLGMSGNLMSLGAIDFGLVVDGAVVMVEGALATMALQKTSARDALLREGRAVGRPVAFGVCIIGIVYVPVLLLEGIEGKMFRPMAWTVLFAIGTALILTFTWIPMLASVVLRKAPATEVFLLRYARRFYVPLLDAVLARPALAIAAAVAMMAVGAASALGRGAEFVPKLEEGDFVIQLTRPPSVSVTESVRGTSAVEAVLGKFPEVRRVVTRSGSPDVATDVMGIEQSDMFVILAPRSEWKTAHDRAALIRVFNAEIRKVLPGTGFSFSQPIDMRFQELLGGMRSDLGVKVHGDELATLTRIGTEVSQLLSGLDGAADVRMEPTTGLAMTTLTPNPQRSGRVGVRTDTVREGIQALRAGRIVGLLAERERRFEVAVRTDSPPAPDAAALARLPLVLEDGRALPLGDVCDIVEQEGPAQISREQARRRVMVEANVRGRDLGSFVGELSARLDKIELPPGYHFSISGQYENLVHAANRLALIVPATLATIFMLLFLTFNDARAALLILLNVPAAASGGMLALAARGLPLSISAAVGFIALFGVATLNGVVLVSAIQRFEREGVAPRQAARAAAHERIRPVLTTAVVASLGFLPMALATGTGAEVQRPLATVVMGGLVTATMLTLGLLPALYASVRRRGAADAPARATIRTEPAAGARVEQPASPH